MDEILSLSKRRGFVFPGSSIYGGLANTWDYGPLGTEMRKNIKDLWWKTFVQGREDVVGLESSILMNPKVWEASGHVSTFTDALVDCRVCKSRFRADHLIEDELHIKAEGKTLSELSALIEEKKLTCPQCSSANFTEVRKFNLLFETNIGSIQGEGSKVYLRGETAQGMFVNFKHVLDTIHKKIPFGIAQIGKVFRNEITPGNFIFRLLEFEQMEIEYFVEEKNWQETFEMWREEMFGWLKMIGIDQDNIRIREHSQEELSHYSKKTIDFEYHFPFGWKELYGLAYRTDFDLSNHQKHSGADLQYFDQESNKRYTPHVIEPTFGVDRTFLMLLLDAYHEEEVKGEKRVVLKLPPTLSAFQAAVLPLSKKEELTSKANALFHDLQKTFRIEYDETQSIGRRYRRQDEIGTPFCITVDFETKNDQKVTVRNRDTMNQDRVALNALKEYLSKNISN